MVARIPRALLLAAPLVLTSLVYSGWAEGTTPEYRLATMHRQPLFAEVMAASVVGWVLGLVKGFSGTKDWLQRYASSAPGFALFVGDLVVFVLVGAYFGTGIFRPTDFLQAVAAGLTWPIGLGALATKD